jgi:hypothetical protein
MATFCHSPSSVYPTQEGIPVELRPLQADAGQRYLIEGPVRERTGPYQNVRSPLYVKGPDGLKPLP